MKINEMGKFVLIDDTSRQYVLEEETNVICIEKGKIFIGNNAITHLNTADVIFTIYFTNEDIILIKTKGKIYINDCEVMSTSCNLSDNVIISTPQNNMQFKFICNDLALEKLIDMFMDGNLYYPLNMDYLFYEYAKKIKITDIKAISNVMASIDIPEIDEL